MGRRRSASDESSLDLLLDTITNTLGGILFLAILLVLLTKASKALVAEGRNAPPVETEAILDQIQEAEVELSSLQAELALSTTMLDQLADTDRRTLGGAISASRAEIAASSLEREKLATAIEEGGKQSASINTARAEVSEAIEARRAYLADLLSELQDEVESRKEDLPLPRERAAQREFFSIVVRYGRLYFDRQSSPFDTNEPNLGDFLDLGSERGEGFLTKFQVVTPKPWKGTVVLRSNGLTLAAKRAIKAWSPSRYYVTVSIWDDSFAEMRALREFFVKQGYQYRLIPVTDGDEVRETAVPNPQVQ